MGERTFKRKVSIQAVDLSTGSVLIFDETTPSKYIPSAIVGSASIPGLFPATHLDQYALVDGGVFTNMDVGEAIARCKEIVDKDEDIIVDMVLLLSEPEEIDKWTLS